MEQQAHAIGQQVEHAAAMHHFHVELAVVRHRAVRDLPGRRTSACC
jgi:hypothetical protein